MRITDNSNFFNVADILEVTLEDGEEVTGEVQAVHESENLIRIYVRSERRDRLVEPVSVRRVSSNSKQWYVEDGRVKFSFGWER